MKSLISRSVLFFASLLTTIYTFAQDGGDKKLDVDVNVNKGSTWYAQPWVWIVGGAVFILLLVALLRGNGRRDD